MHQSIETVIENFRKIKQALKSKFSRNKGNPQFILFRDFLRCETTASFLGFSFVPNQQGSSNKWIRLNWRLFQPAIFILLILEIISFAISIKNKMIVTMVDNMFSCGSLFIILFKIYIVYHHNRTKVNEVIEILDKNFPHSGVDQLTFKAYKYLKDIKAVEKGYCFIVSILTFQFCSVPYQHQIYSKIKDIDVEWELILPVSLPFDELQTIVYEILMIFEVWLIVFSWLSIISTDLLFASLMKILIMEFDILSQVIGKIDVIDDEKHAIMELKKFIKIHQELIDASKKLEEIFSPLELINAFGSITALCTTCFLTASGVGGYFFAKYFILLLVVPIQIFTQCYYTQLLIDSSTSIFDSIYDVNWFSRSVHLRRYLLQIMVRAQKAQTITAWKFFEMSLENFSWIISTSYSYFSVLQGLYG